VKYPSIDVIVNPGAADDGELVLESPGVGLYSCAPRRGEVLVAGSRVGLLTSLGRTVSLVLPGGATGRVVERLLPTRSDPVDYGQTLLRLMPVEASLGEDVIVDKAEEVSRGLPDGAFAVTSPTHGVFYRRPRPEEPAYVEVGQIVERGSTVGLVEVMKSFSAITYGDDRLPSRAEIVEARADDGAEVETDQILFVVRPV
jgi:acetyl-CoA carboxylase biotin carboxyl carrier protein